MASAGTYASLHLAPDRQPRQHSTTQFFYRLDALPVAQQQRQSTEGNHKDVTKMFFFLSTADACV